MNIIGNVIIVTFDPCLHKLLEIFINDINSDILDFDFSFAINTLLILEQNL